MMYAKIISGLQKILSKYKPLSILLISLCLLVIISTFGVIDENEDNKSEGVWGCGGARVTKNLRVSDTNYLYLVESSKNLTDGLVAHYDFDEKEGAAIIDSSENGNDGTICSVSKSSNCQYPNNVICNPLNCDCETDGSWSNENGLNSIHLNGDNCIYVEPSDSLNISKKGTISLWIKPEKQKGGLISWTNGSSWENIHFSFGIKNKDDEKELQLAMYSESTSGYYQYKEKYLPQIGEWLHLVLTYDRETISLFRDGIRVSFNQQTHWPEMKNIPLQIGYNYGIGTGSFVGLMDDLRIYNRVLSDIEIMELYKSDATLRGKNPTYFNKVKILKAVANPDSGRVYADLDFKEMWPFPEKISLKASLSDSSNQIIVTDVAKLSPVFGSAMVDLDVANLPAGKYNLMIIPSDGSQGVSLENASTDIIWPGRSQDFKGVKILNNFCWELLNIGTGSKLKSEYTFKNPMGRWIYVFSRANGELTLNIKGAVPEKVRDGTGAEIQESMRYLPKGQYIISVVGGGTLQKLVIRSVPHMMYYFGNPEFPPFGPYDFEYLTKSDILANFNSMIMLDVEYNQEKTNAEKWVKSGKPLIQRISECEGANKDTIIECLKGELGFTDDNFRGVIFDELWPHRENLDKLTEAIKNIISAKPDKLFIPYFTTGMSVKDAFNAPDAPYGKLFIETLLNFGSPVAWERYLPEMPSEDKAMLLIRNYLSSEMLSWEELFPGVTKQMVVTFGTATQSEGYNNYPSVSFKVFWDMQMEHLATHPNFFGLGGIQAYNLPNTDKQYLELISKLMRHYGLKGGKKRFLEDPYNLNHISDPDFKANPLAWALEKANNDSMEYRELNDYGWLEGRYPRTKAGDTFLWMKRNANKANCAIQTINDLIKDKLYVLKLKAADYGDITSGTSKEKATGLTIDLGNVEIQSDPKETFAYNYPSNYAHKYPYPYPDETKILFDSSNPAHIEYHHIVFKALSTTSKLSISDWTNCTANGKPNGTIGQEIMINFIEIEPFFVGTNFTDPDIDSDQDGFDDMTDNCPTKYNSNQVNSDGDSFGDICDPCPKDPNNDIDKDRVCGNIDNCPSLYNPNQENADGDRFGNICDVCPYNPNINQKGRCQKSVRVKK